MLVYSRVRFALYEKRGCLPAVYAKTACMRYLQGCEHASDRRQVKTHLPNAGLNTLTMESVPRTNSVGARWHGVPLCRRHAWGIGWTIGHPHAPSDLEDGGGRSSIGQLLSLKHGTACHGGCVPFWQTFQSSKRPPFPLGGWLVDRLPVTAHVGVVIVCGATGGRYDAMPSLPCPCCAKELQKHLDRHVDVRQEG